MAQINKLH